MSPRGLRLSLLLRSFLVQASWNYRTLIGTGVAWALLPVTRRLHSTEPEATAGPVVDEPFNAHPYLSPVALGALARIASDGVDPDMARRFKDALRSPLGSLGDKLVWGAWRPFCAVAAVLLAATGAGPIVVVVLFLGAYNLLHLTLRIWGVGAGFRAGLDVGGALSRVRLAERSERVEAAGVLVFGSLLGLLLVTTLSRSESAVLWIPAGLVLLLIGVARGEALRRWAPAFLVAPVVLGLLLGP